jgi:AraC-like DNA-binding protein
MKSSQPHNHISVWRPSDLDHLELRRGIGTTTPIPRHWHEEFQLCLIESGEGEMSYRRETHLTPPASLFIVHPGEIHSNRSYHSTGCTYRTLFIQSDFMRQATPQTFGRDGGVPFIPTTVIFDRDFLELFVQLHVALGSPCSTLERQSLLYTFTTRLITQFGEQRSVRSSFGEKRVDVKRACEYLFESYAKNVLLEELADLAGLSPYHFNRVFCEQIGMPPHAFQTQVRVARAKKLLFEGWPISEVAVRTGFADQSHLTRHFKRLCGVTPGQYQQGSKNIQDIN